MTNSRTRLRRLGLALGAVVTVLSVSPLLANAEPIGPTDPGVRCAAKVGPGQYEFYLPGEKATDVNGNKWVCGPDGQWFRDYSALVVWGTSSKVSVISSYVVAR